MAHTSSIFDAQPIRVQNVNGFDLSHLNAGTAKCGQLTPVLCRLLMQGTKFSLGCALNVELPPLATSFFGKVDAHIEVFFVKCSILYGGWKQFISNNVKTSLTGPLSSNASDLDAGFELPYFTMTSFIVGETQSLLATNDGLLDYMNFRYTGVDSKTVRTRFSLLSLLAYHLIWDCFYRNPNVTRTIFAVNPNLNGASSLNAKNVSLIWHSYYSADSTLSAVRGNFDTSTSEIYFPDSMSVFEMRQRNYPRDYFTAASVNPQQIGTNPSSVQFTVDLNTGDGEFTIASLRAANSLQKFLESNNYSSRYDDIMRAHFGKTPSDADDNEPIYIGRLVVPVYQKSVYNNSSPSVNSSDAIVNNSTNQFASYLGGKGSHGEFSGSGSITQGFTAGCFGYLIGLFSLVPHAMYSYGIDRHWRCVRVGDFPFPELQSVGMDAIKNSEIYAQGALVSDGDFAYIPRYSWIKYVDDSVHGELRPGKSLENFVLQRRFTSAPVFGTSFLEIPQNALDSVMAVPVSTSHFSCWYEVFWEFKAVMPLAAFCVPTLGELQDTHTIKVNQGGSRL